MKFEDLDGQWKAPRIVASVAEDGSLLVQRKVDDSSVEHGYIIVLDNVPKRGKTALEIEAARLDGDVVKAMDNLGLTRFDTPDEAAHRCK
jgi:hypothetical protein